ncbi:MAG: serine/threonine protein kinase [Chloroflexaceae bacterium]|nr:serine/threonine protein kinase [Chloroflexaceae bacterium]
MLEAQTVLHQRYQIVRLIGQGGMGAVYEAVDQTLGNTVALKQTLLSRQWLPTQHAQLSRAFEREARLLASLRHRALPRVIDYFVNEDGQFLVMDYIVGTDLGVLLEQHVEPFALPDVLCWMDQLLDVLDYLHTHEPAVIHRDIKPRNLKLTQRGDIILLDFGLARQQRSPGQRQSSSIVGYTLHYAPLEQIQGSGTDARSDLYALAATIYHLLTRVAPPDVLTRATMVMAQQTDPLVPLSVLDPRIPSALSDLVLPSMAITAADRPASAATMRATLQAIRHRSGRPSTDQSVAQADARTADSATGAVVSTTRPFVSAADSKNAQHSLPPPPLPLAEPWPAPMPPAHTVQQQRLPLLVPLILIVSGIFLMVCALIGLFFTSNSAINDVVRYPGVACHCSVFSHMMTFL